MAVIANVVVRGVMITSNLCLDAYLIKKGLEVINFVAKNVFKSSRPEQFVVTLMGKAPGLFNRFIHLLDWKVGGVLAIVSVASLFLWVKLDANFGNVPEAVVNFFIYTNPAYYIVPEDYFPNGPHD